MAKKKPDSDAAPALSKAEAVRQTVAAGVEKPAEGVVYVKETFGLDITPQMFSIYKGKSKRGPSGRRGSGENVSLDVLPAVKKLVEQFGADAVVRVAEFLR